ncbi:MAG: PBP1b-binding outer membrane lipoprotein LpoB, partial [Flavobacterium sp.]
MKNKIVAILTLSTLIFTSCSTDENPSENNLNYTVPTSYSFERNSTTTVDYSGQTTRINMLQEMGDYYRIQATANATISATKLSSMYSNTANAFANAALNESGKQLKEKTASSLDYFNLLQGGGTLS